MPQVTVLFSDISTLVTQSKNLFGAIFFSYFFSKLRLQKYIRPLFVCQTALFFRKKLTSVTPSKILFPANFFSEVHWARVLFSKSSISATPSKVLFSSTFIEEIFRKYGSKTAFQMPRGACQQPFGASNIPSGASNRTGEDCQCTCGKRGQPFVFCESADCEHGGEYYAEGQDMDPDSCQIEIRGNNFSGNSSSSDSARAAGSTWSARMLRKTLSASRAASPIPAWLQAVLAAAAKQQAAKAKAAKANNATKVRQGS